MATASSKPVSEQMTGTTRRLVRMPTSSMEMTSRGLVMARTRLPLSSMLMGRSRRRTMKSRGSRPSAAGCGATWVRSTTPMCIWPATAVMMSCSVTRPWATRRSPSRPPASFWMSKASTSCSRVTRPLATSRSPSLRRPLPRCLSPLRRPAMRGFRSSGANGLWTYSSAPARCACSNVAKSLADERASSGILRNFGSPPMRLRSSKGSNVTRSRSRTMAAGGSSCSMRRVPGSPRLVVTW